VRAAALLGIACAVAPAAHASLALGSAGASYSQSFDSLSTTGSANAWLNDATLQGWSLFVQPAPGSAVTAYVAGDGSGNTGGFYSYGSTGSADRALGGLGSGGAYFGAPASGAVAGWIVLALTNTSGHMLDGFTLHYDGEQWRNGGNTSAQTMVLEYGFGASFASVSSWTAAGALFNWASLVNTATAAAVNGNTTGLAANRGGTVNTAWNDGQTLWLRWIENNDPGNDHGLAIDNLSFTAGQEVPAAVPLPPPFALMAAALGAMGFVSRRLRERR
jgi:hypothetical protein